VGNEILLLSAQPPGISRLVASRLTLVFPFVLEHDFFFCEESGMPGVDLYEDNPTSCIPWTGWPKLRAVVGGKPTGTALPNLRV
jgi:hypothetical protein